MYLANSSRLSAKMDAYMVVGGALNRANSTNTVEQGVLFALEKQNS